MRCHSGLRSYIVCRILIGHGYDCYNLAGGQRKCLEIGKAPEVTFALSDEKPTAVYAYCNLHGLWKTDI